MKKLLIALMFVFMASQAHAQSTAIPSVIGYLSTTCPGTQNPCFLPYSPVAAVVSSAAETSHVLKASGGSLLSLSVTSTVAGYVELFNATSAPSTGVVTPVACYSVPANTTTSLPFQIVPQYFSTGITAVFSSGTNCFTYTSSATAYLSAGVQ